VMLKNVFFVHLRHLLVTDFASYGEILKRQRLSREKKKAQAAQNKNEILKRQRLSREKKKSTGCTNCSV
jgi:hypothetical protein